MVSRAGVNYHALGLVHDHQAGILVDYIKGNILGEQGFRFRIGPTKFQEIAGFYQAGNLYLFSVHHCPQFLCLNLGTGKQAEIFGDIPVKPQFSRNGAGHRP